MGGHVLGAGVLPVTIDPSGKVFFLLGKERVVTGWRGSGGWSAFEGGTKNIDNDHVCTAAREYIEESLGILHLNESGCTEELIKKQCELLRNREYILRVTLKIVDPIRTPRFHVTYVTFFDWDPKIVSMFGTQRDMLLSQSEQFAVDSGASVHPELQGHAAIQQNTILPDFLEKSEIGLWSMNSLKSALKTGFTAGETFRPCFLRTLEAVLNDFEHRMAQFDDTDI